MWMLRRAGPWSGWARVSSCRPRTPQKASAPSAKNGLPVFQENTQTGGDPLPKAQTKNQPGYRYVRNFCFLCGPDNPQGMRLKFSVNPDHSAVRGTFHLAHRYGGPASLAHDGIVAAVVEEAMAKLNSRGKRAGRIAAMTWEVL